MTGSLNQLAKAALLGSIEQSPLPGQAADLSLPADADGMLMAAGILGLYQSAGLQLITHEAMLPEACGEESLNPPSSQASQLFHTILESDFHPLIRQTLEYFHAKSWHPPSSCLPRLLHVGTKYSDLHIHIRHVAGERGRWLAQQNPDWQYLGYSTDALDEALWDEGVLKQRIEYLQRLRAVEPQQAREKLVESFAAETAKNRTALLETLVQGLSLDDEAFLQTALTDRSKEVVKVASGLLARLPQSQLSQQAQALLESCLSWKGKIKKYWDFEPPEQFSDELKALGIQEKANFGRNIGQRAAWLLQLIRIVPLAWWTEMLGHSPLELYTQAKKTTWTEAIRLAWQQVVLEQGNAIWAKQLLQAGHLDGDALLVLDVDDIAEVMQTFADKEPKKFSQYFRDFLDTTLQQQCCWSANDSRFFLKAVQQHIARSKIYYEFRECIPLLACVLHSEVLPEALDHWPQEVEHWGYYAEVFAEFSRFVQLRMTLEQA